MEETSAPTSKLTHPIFGGSSLNRILMTALVLSLVLGSATGIILGSKQSNNGGGIISPGSGTPKSAEQDNRTFRDFAEGTVKTVAQPKNGAQYAEGTHILEREGAMPVALTSSVVDLSQYEGKKVKVFGETQKALKAGWLMDVGRVEELN